MRKIALLALFLAGCVPEPGVVSAYNGASVTIRQGTFATVAQVTPEIEAEADRLCSANGKRAEFASTISAPDASYAEHLFLCL